MDEATLQVIASQLRKPEGVAGIETALQMNRSNRLMNVFAFEAVAPAPGEQILEICMGNGEFVETLTRNDPSIHYVGLDYSQTMIDEAAKRNEELVRSGQAQFVYATADAIPFPDGTFDKIVGVNTIYFWDPDKELQELYRVLKPGGKLVLGIRAKDIMSRLPFTEYGFILYSPEDLRLVLERNGYTVAGLEVKQEPAYEFEGEQKKLETIVATAQK
jgi:SAM-dependent methyltransferase